MSIHIVYRFTEKKKNVYVVGYIVILYYGVVERLVCRPFGKVIFGVTHRLVCRPFRKVIFGVVHLCSTVVLFIDSLNYTEIFTRVVNSLSR